MIRKMVPADIDTIMQIWFTSNCEAHSFIPQSYWEEQRPAVQAAIQQADVYCFVDNQGIIQGFIGLTGNYIAGLFVAANFRSHGVGRQLLEVAKDKYVFLELDAYQKNPRAINFYQHNGFSITHQTSDEVRMAWSVEK